MTTGSSSRDVLDWVATSVGSAAAHWSRRLAGGTHALTDVIRTSDGRELVLRRFPSGDDAVRRETRVLDALGGLDGLVPRLLATDPDGALLGAPTILTTLLPGHAHITPDDPPSFATQLARALAHIHAHAPDPGLPDVLAAPRWAADTAVLRGAWSRLHTAPRVLTHRDFWSGNTLWRDGRLTGVVDWSGAGLAPRGFDLSWARLDLILMYDRAVADVFTKAYEAAAGTSVPDLGRWDLYAATKAGRDVESWAPNYQDLGRVDLGPATLRQRLTEWQLLIRRDG